MEGGLSRRCLIIGVKGLRKTVGNFVHDSRCPGRD